MGHTVDPALLTESGEKCLLRLCELPSLGLPTAQLITVIGTVVEGHVSRILGQLVVLSDVDSTPLGRALLDGIRGMDDSWPKRDRWLSRGFELDYTDRAAYQNFKVLVAARNAVVHGDGALTDRQSRGINDLLELRRSFQRVLEATVRGRITFGSDSSDRAMQIARQFVAEFDEIVIGKYPEIRPL